MYARRAILAGVASRAVDRASFVRRLSPRLKEPAMPTVQSTLAQSLTLPNGQVIPNRLVKSAMSETLGPADNGVPASIATLYGRWADGGVGLSITGNVMVDRKALGEAGNIALEDDRDLDALRAWAAAGQRNGGLIYMQINHPGRFQPIHQTERQHQHGQHRQCDAHPLLPAVGENLHCRFTFGLGGDFRFNQGFLLRFLITRHQQIVSQAGSK